MALSVQKQVTVSSGNSGSFAMYVHNQCLALYVINSKRIYKHCLSELCTPANYNLITSNNIILTFGG